MLNSFVYADNIVKGSTYELRYRAWNINGPGPWSLEGYVLAASVPSMPVAPVYVSSDLQSVTLGFTASADNGGLIISGYVLQITELTLTNWRDVTTFVTTAATPLTHTMTVADDGLVPHLKYRWQIKAVNDYGSSLWSPSLALSVAPLPSAPTAPLKT